MESETLVNTAAITIANAAAAAGTSAYGRSHPALVCGEASEGR